MSVKEVAAAVFDVLHAVMERYLEDRDLSDRVKKYEELVMSGAGGAEKVLGILAQELREAHRRKTVRGRFELPRVGRA